MTDALRRFARTLVQRLGETPGGPHRAVTVEELRSRLLPYRAYRSVLGFESVEDYDVVVMRLVGEEGGFVRTLPPLAAERCRAETGGPAPNPELLDQLADVTIQIGAESLGRIFDESAPVPAPAPIRDDLDIIERHLELEVREPVEPAPVLTRRRAPAPPPPPPPPSPRRPPVAAPEKPPTERPAASAPAPLRAPLPDPDPDPLPAAAAPLPPPPPPVPEPPRAPASPPMPEAAPPTEARPVPPKPQLKPRRPLAPSPRPAPRPPAASAPDTPPPEPPPQAEPAPPPTESAGYAEATESPPPPRVESPSSIQETARMAKPAAPTATCRSCHQSLPGGRQVVFCPWCGERLVPFACPECHTELDAQWKHCITCGAPVKNPPRSP